MTLDGYHSDVMRSKTWACWIFFVGFVLSLGAARGCFSFEEHITNNLLKDHLFEIRYFQHPSETVKEGYTRLSIVDMMCTSLKKYGNMYDVNTSINETNNLEKVTWSYKHIVTTFLSLTEKDNYLTACEKHICNFNFSTSYISADELEGKYYSACSWTGTMPACPSPPNTSPSPLKVSHTTSTPSPTHPLTSTPSHTTIHQSTSVTPSSSSQLRNMTSPSASNNTETPPACQPMSSNNLTDHPSKTDRQKSDNLQKKINKNVLLSLLLTVSCTVNVALFIVVWWQCRNRQQKNLLDYYEENQKDQHYVQLLYLRSGEQNSSEDNRHTSELTCLQNRREQSEDYGISSSPAT